MHIVRRSLIITVATALVLCASAARASGGDLPAWPSEQEEHMAELDTRLLDTKQKLFAARQGNDQEATERLTKEFKECQAERAKLLRAMGHLHD